MPRAEKIDPGQFQSTPAHERATQFTPTTVTMFRVSIHARSRAGDLHREENGRIPRCFNPRPLTSGRPFDSARAHSMESFNPRPLTSGRPYGDEDAAKVLTFQSTPAHERATPERLWRELCPKVSIHARSRAGDAAETIPSRIHRGFNPRPLTSGRPT